MSEHRGHENGQALVQVALMLVVLLGFLALAVDVSQVYLKRRQLQNAADAGALEGARQMCFENQTWSQAQGPATIVAQNNAPGANVIFPTAPAWQMTVVVSQTIPSFAASILGQSQFGPGARATAVCGGADQVCGLWPIAFSLSEWNRINAGGAGCGREFFIWNGQNTENPPDCQLYDCDIYPLPTGDGLDDVMDTQGRAWLDFSGNVDPLYANSCTGSGCGTSEMACWIRNDSPVRLTIPGCIGGTRGVRGGVQVPIEDRIRMGDSVNIPLFNGMGCAAPNVCANESYTVVGLGCVKPLAWEQSLRLDAILSTTRPPQYIGKFIRVKVDCTPGACTTACGSTSGATPVPGGVNAVSLIE